jgi:exodeoxyribonuclease VII small subunit
MIPLRRAPETEPAAAPDKFEDLLARLEQIVGDMEGAELPLEKLLSSYEEGMRLVKACGDRLADAEQKIEILSKGAAAATASSINSGTQSAATPLAGLADTSISPSPTGEEEIRLI